MTERKKSNTIAVRSGLCKDTQTKALIPPIHLSSTYTLEGLNKKGRYDYSRTQNPTRNILAEAIAQLEGVEQSIITNTGMSAIHLVCQLLNPNDTLVIPHDCYGGSYRLFTHCAARGLFKVKVIDQNNPNDISEAVAGKPKMIWIETPSNPLLRIYDIQTLAETFHTVGALVTVDNTFLSPIFQSPFALGADIVVHSCTKFINGHSDIVSGAAIAKDNEIHEQLAWWANCLGLTGSAFDSYMVLRGIRTLPLRMREHEENTKHVVNLLTQHQAISTVYYPGLPSHAGHDIACNQQRGFGSLVSFQLKGGAQAVETLLQNLCIFTQAQSLGGVESLINHPATMTHASMSETAQEAAGISAGLLRLSVGIESAEDLVNDLKMALDQLL